jgi:hypothetical protein
MITVGDLVFHADDPGSLGLVIKVINDVEIPSLIEIFWGESWHEYLSFNRVYADDLTVVNKI